MVSSMRILIQEMLDAIDSSKLTVQKCQAKGLLGTFDDDSLVENFEADIKALKMAIDGILTECDNRAASARFFTSILRACSSKERQSYNEKKKDQLNAIVQQTKKINMTESTHTRLTSTRREKLGKPFLDIVFEDPPDLTSLSNRKSIALQCSPLVMSWLTSSGSQSKERETTEKLITGDIFFILKVTAKGILKMWNVNAHDIDTSHKGQDDLSTSILCCKDIVHIIYNHICYKCLSCNLIKHIHDAVAAVFDVHIMLLRFKDAAEYHKRREGENNQPCALHIFSEQLDDVGGKIKKKMTEVQNTLGDIKTDQQICMITPMSTEPGASRSLATAAFCRSPIGRRSAVDSGSAIADNDGEFDDAQNEEQAGDDTTQRVAVLMADEYESSDEDKMKNANTQMEAAKKYWASPGRDLSFETCYTELETKLGLKHIRVSAEPFRTPSENVGAGSYGIVRSTTPLTVGFSNNQVAVKVIRVELETHRQFLVHEATVWNKLEHENIVGLTAFTTVHIGGIEVFGLVSTKYGKNLSHYIRDTTPTIERLQLLRDIAHGIGYLHSRMPQIIHGDLRAANVVIDRKNDSVVGARICDFGISTIVLADKKINSGKYTALPWLANELVGENGQGCGQIDEWSDMYSYGILAHEVFTGHSPWSKLDDKAIAKLKLGMQLPPRLPSESVKPEYWDLIHALCNIIKTDRCTPVKVISRLDVFINDERRHDAL